MRSEGSGTRTLAEVRYLARMFAKARQAVERQPLTWIMVLAAVVRLPAAFLSGGYFAHDDHFLVIEAAQSWVDGADYNYWLPWNQYGLPHPSGHMMVYPGLHYLLLRAWQWLGLVDPETKMVLVRILHAAWSLVTVHVGYRMLLRLAGARAALGGGLLLALLWFMPFLSVRNLVEMVSAPLLMLSAWWCMRADAADGAARDAGAEGSVVRHLLIAGLMAGLAVNVRFQTIFVPAGMGLGLLLQRRWRGAAAFALGVLAPLVMLQGAIDMAIWGRPFAELTEYVRYNLDNPDNTGIMLPWYQYLLILGLVFVPPLSFAVLFGFLRSPRPLPAWLGVATFILFHSLFPNKQERFILPVVPLFLVLGYAAWENRRTRSAWWQRRPALHRRTTAAVWALNGLLLLPLSVSFSKRQQVKAMVMLRGQPGIRGVLVDDTVERDAPLMPLYYWGRWGAVNAPYTDPAVDMKALVAGWPPALRPNAVLLVGPEDLQARVARATRAMGPLAFVGAAEPGLLDRTLHRLNPMNRNATILVFAAREAVAGAPGARR